MLTYLCQTEVLKFLPFEKRCQLAKRCPDLQNRHRKLPFYLENVEIRQSEDNFSLKIEQFVTLIERNGTGTRINFGKEVKYQLECIHQETSTYAVGALALRVLEFYFGRKGTTRIGKMVIKGDVHIPKHITPFKITNLEVRSDVNIANWFHIIKGNILRTAHLSGRSVFDLIEEKEIQNLENVSIAPSCIDIQSEVLRKLTKNRYLRFEFNCFLRKYHELAEEIRSISLQDRPIGSTIDYYVRDYFNNKLYPNFSKIVRELKANLVKIGAINAISIPMRNAELNVFIVDNTGKESEGNAWILRMVVTEKRD